MTVIIRATRIQIRDFSLLHSAHTGSFLGEKLLESETNHSHPSSGEVRDGGAIPSLPMYYDGVVVN
jgi:hypothetical protein